MAIAPLFRAAVLRIIVALLLVALAAWAGLRLPEENAADGLAYDFLSLARSHLAPVPIQSENSGVAVIALDPRTLLSDEITPLPRVMMAPIWAEVLGASLAAGARSVAFDIIFAYSANRFINNYDLPLLRMLGTQRGKIVLARSLWTLPARPMLLASGAERQPHILGQVELLPDADGVYRRVPRFVDDGQTPRPGLAYAAYRAAGFKEDYPQSVMVAPDTKLEQQIPTYSVIDILRCARAHPGAVAPALEKALGGKILFVGTTLPEEDRKETPERFFPRSSEQKNNPEIVLTDPCDFAPSGLSALESRTVPGVFIHAAAVQSVLKGQLMQPLPRWAVAMTMAILALLGFLLAMRFKLLHASLLAVATVLAVSVVALFLFMRFEWLPVASVLGAFLLSLLLSYLLRFAQEERRRQAIQHAFGHYLPRSIVDQLAAGGEALSLGGAQRDVSIMFADLSGFTRLSTLLGPEALMQTTNIYLALIAQAVEESGGYVDKFIGDAVMAMWNAPLALEKPALAAVRGAMAARDAVLQRQAEDEARGQPGYAVKIGVNTGPAIVGNVGTAQRMNYTVVGEAVNIAARLESVPKDYGISLVIGESSADLVGADLFLLELDLIRVVGRAKPLSVFMPLCAQPPLPILAAAAQRYTEALSLYRAMQFSAAEAAWLQLADDLAKPAEFVEKSLSPILSAEIMAASRKMAERAAAYALSPPVLDDGAEIWDGVYTRSGK